MAWWQWLLQGTGAFALIVAVLVALVVVALTIADAVRVWREHTWSSGFAAGEKHMMPGKWVPPETLYRFDAQLETYLREPKR